MHQGDDYEDGYYDDDDYYDDDESQGPSVLVLVLVAVVLVMGLAAVCIGGYLYLEQKRDPGAGGLVDEGPEAVEPAEGETDFDTEPVGAGAEGASADPEPAGPATADPEPAAPAASVTPEPEPKVTDPPPAPVRETRVVTNDRSFEPRSRERSSERAGDGSSEAAARSSRGSRGRTDTGGRSADIASEGSSRDSGENRRSVARDQDFAARGASSQSSGSSGRSILISNGSGSSSDLPSKSDSGDIRPGDIVESSTSEESRSSRRKNYDKEAIAALGSRASSGKLDHDEIDGLKAVSPESRNFTRAWATVLKNAEKKRNYKEHCNAAQRIMSLPQNKHHPEWNLEMAKCQMRNGQYQSAVSSVDRTLLDSYEMTASTKARRLLTAYEIRAVSKTQIFERNAKANSGLADAGKLRSALEAWTAYKNYAAGIGNTNALRRSQKEISDLEDRG